MKSGIFTGVHGVSKNNDRKHFVNRQLCIFQFVRYHSNPRTVYMIDTHFVTYTTGVNTHPFRDKSGAYIFLPDGVAKVRIKRNYDFF